MGFKSFITVNVASTVSVVVLLPLVPVTVIVAIWLPIPSPEFGRTVNVDVSPAAIEALLNALTVYSVAVVFDNVTVCVPSLVIVTI